MSYYPNPNRHIYASSSSHRVSMRPNLSWSTIREESSSDLLASEIDEKRERINRLKKLERLKERRYMDYQSLKRRGSSKEYSDRFQRDCEEFNQLKYRQVHHTPRSTFSFQSKHRSASVSDFTTRRNQLLYGSRYGHTSYLRGNQDDGQTLSPAGSISSIVTLDDDYMYGSRYSTEDNWASWRPRSRTSSLSMSRDRLGHYGLSSHEMLDDNLFDDASSEYSYSGYMPQRRAFSSCVTPRRYSGMMTPTAQSADAAATVERMNQLSERLKLLQTERVHMERRRSVDLGSSHARSDYLSIDHTDTASASVQGRFSQNSQTTILPKSPTDHSIPSWSQRVNLLLSSHHQDVPDPDTEYSSSHVETSPSYTNASRNHSEILDSTHSANIRSFHSVNSRESQDNSYRSPNLKTDALSRSFIYQRPESSSSPMSTSTSEMRQERVSVHSPSHLSMTSVDTHYGSVPIDTTYEYEDGQRFHTSHSNIQHTTNVTDTHHRTINLQQPRYTSSKTEYSTHVLRDGQPHETGVDLNSNSKRTIGEFHYTSDLSPSPLSPGSQSKNFATHDTRTIIRHSQQGSEITSQDDISDSGVESSSDLGMVSNSVSSDSISKFVVSASKPSESRGITKFEISLGSSDQKADSSQLSPKESTYHSFQEAPTRDCQDSTNYHSTTRTTYRYGKSLQTTVTEQNNAQCGRHDTVESDKAISDVANVVARKERTIEVEHPAAKKMATVNVEMNVSQPNSSGTNFVSENQSMDRSQQQSTKTKPVSQTMMSVQKKQASSDILYAETKPSATATLKMVTKGSEEIVEKPSQMELQNQSLGQNSSELVTSDIKTYYVDSNDTRNKSSESVIRKDNSSIFDKTDSETIMESTSTTVVNTVKNYSTETIEQGSGNNVQYNQNDIQTVKSTDPMNYTVSQELITSNKVSETAPLVRKTEKTEISSKTPDDKNTNNISKTLSSNQKETLPTVFKTDSDKLESADILVRKSVQISGPNISESVQENGSSNIMESAVSKESDVSDPNAATPKKKKSKKKKSLKNGLDSQSKAEEPISTAETSVDLEISSPTIDDKKGQPKVSISSQQVSQKELDNMSKTTSQEKSVSITTQKSSTSKADSLSDIYQNGTKEKSSGTVITQSIHLKQQQPIKDTPLMLGTNTKVSEQISESVTSKTLGVKVFESDTKSQNEAVMAPSKQPHTKGKNSTQVEVRTLQLKSPQQTRSFKSNEVNVSKDEFQSTPTDGTTNLTIVETKELMDATRETLEQLQSGDQNSWVEVSKEKTQSPISSKLVTTSYQMISSVDNVGTQEPGRRNKKTVEHYLGLEPSAEVLSLKNEETVATESTKEKSKKKKKNSSKGKEVKQSENLSEKSDQFSNQVEDKKIFQSKEESNLSEKAITTSTITANISKSSETSEKYNVGSVSTEFHSQGPQQSEFTQGNLADKTATTVKMAANKMAPGMADLAEEYKTKSQSVEFPGQQTGLGKDGEVITKVTTMTKTTSYKVDPGMQSGPEAYNVQSATFPGRAEDSEQTGFQEQGDTFSKVTTTTKTFGYKTSESPEVYNVQNISAEFPGQVNAPQQMEFTQGNMVDKIATVSKSAGYKMVPGMSDRPEEYHVQSISAQFPGQGPQQTEFAQGNLADKTATTMNVSTHEIVPGRSDKPEDYNMKSFSAEFPEQQTGIVEDDEISTRVTTVTETIYDVDSGLNSKNLAPTKKSITTKTSGKPQDLNLPSISIEVPEGSREKESTQSSFFGRVASTIKNTFSRVSPVSPLSPVSPDKPEISIPSYSDISADSSVDPIKNTNNQTSATIKPTVKDASVSSSVKTATQTNNKNVTLKQLDSKQVSFKNETGEPQSVDTVKTEFFKESVVTKTISNKMSDQPTDNMQSLSTKLPSEVKKPQTTEEGVSSIQVTATTKSTINQATKGQKDSTVQSISAECPGQVKSPQQSEFTQGNMMDKVASTLNTVAYKTPEKPEDFKAESVRVECPGGKAEMVTEITTITKITPEEYYTGSIPTESSSQRPQQSEFTQGNLADKTATTVKMAANKMAPGMADLAEEYKTKSQSVEFPGQQTGLGKDGEVITKVTTMTKTTSYKVDPGMLSGPEAYDVQSATFPGRAEDSEQTGFQEQGDTFSKVTTTTKTFGYKTSESPEEYNVQNISAEFPGQVNAPQQMEFTQGNMVDKIATVSKSAGYKRVPGMSDRPEEYHVQSISAQFPGQGPQQTEFTQGNLADKTAPTMKMSTYKMTPGMSERPEEYNVQSVSADFSGQLNSPTQTDVNHGNIVDKVTTTTVSTSYKMVPETSDNTGEPKVLTVYGEFPDRVSTTTETISANMAPEISKNQNLYQVSSTSALPKETEVQQVDTFSKVIKTSKDIVYKTDKISEKPGELKTQSVSVECPGMQTESEKTVTASEINTTNKTTAEMSVETQKQKPQGKASAASKKGHKKTSEKPEEFYPEPVATEMTKQSKDKPKKEKTGFLGKVATSIKSTFSKKSPEEPANSEEFPELVKDSTCGDLNTPNMASENHKASYKSVVESSTISPTSKTMLQGTTEDQTDNKRNINLKTDNVDGKATTVTKTVDNGAVTEITDKKNVQSTLAELAEQVKSHQQKELTEVTKDIEIVEMKRSITDGTATQSISTEIPVEKKDTELFKSQKETDLSEKAVTASTTETSISNTSKTPEKYNVGSVSTEFHSQRPQQSEFTQGNLADKTATTVKMAANKMAPGMADLAEEYKTKSQSVEFPGQQTGLGKDGEVITKVTTMTKTTSYKVDPGMLSGPEAYNVQSATFPGRAEDSEQTGFQEQGDTFSKVTTTTKTFGYKTSESPEEYNVQNISAEFPGQVKAPQQMEFTQGNMVDKIATVSKSAGYKRVPGMSDRPEEYHVQSISAQFPGQGPQQTEFSQGNLADKTAPARKMSTNKMAPGMSERPEEYNVQSISAQFHGQGPQQTEYTQDNLADKIVEMTAYKMAPGTSERPEEYNVQSISAQFHGQGPQQTEYTQDNLADKTVEMTAYKMAPGMSDRPEEYNVQSISAQFHGQGPQQTEFTQGNLADKTAPAMKMSTNKMAPGMSERPEEYNVQSISAEFPGQLKSSMQTDFTQGNIADIEATTTVSTSYKMVPEMIGEPSLSKDFPLLGDDPKHDLSGIRETQTQTPQVSYKTVLERGIKLPECTKPTSTQKTDISLDTQNSQPSISYTLSKDQLDLKTASLETSHFTLEKPVTTVKTITKTVTTDLTDSSVDLLTDVSMKTGNKQLQQPANTLSQYDSRYIVPSTSTEFSENLKNSETDSSISYSTDFSMASMESAPMIQQKSWSDVVKNGKTADVSVERSQPNISSSISIDKVEKPGDRSPHLQQTENEGRIMSGGSQAFITSASIDTSLPEYADIPSGDVVSPLKAKHTPSKPLLRKLSGQDFSVADVKSSPKPALKLVAPDCLLLQTKFETDGWKPKLKSPTTTTTTTTTIVKSELISQSPSDTANLERDSAPVAPKRRSREFRSVSEDSTEGEAASLTLHLKTQGDISPSSPQSPQPQVPKRKHKKGSKSNRNSSSSMSPDVPESKNLNVSPNLDCSKPVSHPEFRTSDQDVFRDSLLSPTSPVETEIRQNLIPEKITSLNKSPHTSTTSDSGDVGDLQEIKIKTPKVTPQHPLQKSNHPDFIVDDSPIEKNPPFERSYSADKSRTLPLHRKKLPSNSNNSDSDSEEKQKEPLSPASKQKRWKSVEFLKDTRVKPDVPPKNTGLNRVKSTSIKLLSKLQPKSKKPKSPGPDKNVEDYSPDPHDKTGRRATREYPNLEKYPGNNPPSLAFLPNETSPSNISSLKDNIFIQNDKLSRQSVSEFSFSEKKGLQSPHMTHSQSHEKQSRPAKGKRVQIAQKRLLGLIGDEDEL